MLAIQLLPSSAPFVPLISEIKIEMWNANAFSFLGGGHLKKNQPQGNN